MRKTDVKYGLMSWTANRARLVVEGDEWQQGKLEEGDRFVFLKKYLFGCVGSSLWCADSSAVVAACWLSCSVTCGISTGMEPVSSALQGRFLTTGPPGKSQTGCFTGLRMESSSMSLSSYHSNLLEASMAVMEQWYCSAQYSWPWVISSCYFGRSSKNNSEIFKVLWTESVHSSKIHMLRYNLQCDSIWIWTFGRRLGLEGGAFMKGFVPYEKRPVN